MDFCKESKQETTNQNGDFSQQKQEDGVDRTMVF